MWAVLLTPGIVAPRKRLIAVSSRSWLMMGLRVENVPRLIAKPKTPPKRPKIAPEAPTAGAVKEPKYKYARPPAIPLIKKSARKRPRPKDTSAKEPRKYSEIMFSNRCANPECNNALVSR